MKARSLAAAAVLLSLGQPSLAATLIHSNDVLGDIEPCGCRANPQGGMMRKANLLRRTPDADLIQLDAGDLLFSTEAVPSALHEQTELQAKYLLKTMDLMAHDAVVPGEKDFAMGFDVFERLRKASKTRFLAANLMKKDGSKYLDPSMIFEKTDKNGKPLRIGVFAVVGEDLPWPAELKASPAIESAKEQVSKLRSKVDVLIALTHIGYERDRGLALAVPGIDLIVGGHSQAFLQTPEKVESTWLLQSSFRNQFVGVLPLSSPLSMDHYNLVGLDAGYESPVGSPTPMDQLITEARTALEEARNRRIKQLSANGSAEPAKPQTFPSCAECHAKQARFWKKTRHFQALHTLLSKNKATDPACLKCHSLEGFKDPSAIAQTAKGSLNPQQLAQELKSKKPSKLQRAWAPVQCENCHAPGGNHPFSGEYTKAVSNESCLACHSRDRSPKWYDASGQLIAKIFKEKRAKVTCPAGALAEPGSRE